ncbi:MAG: MgtC/SapB family protein [Hydrococcus sp. C42_A2020_068]|uniref:MgtC/SapB family protein n=1 Tax=Pleurocapsa sp. PCC 7327 TaxID=118163 RepID=UPI00029FC755|nr:MgtC/SapB family protein [Pleurocapsa sp. PCC 7327]AFY75886.1 putative membrane protein [Pleurocapsa sp. PCC 7327]MBF2021758.1 MgtC/SapB family protein [Hydrococcus sp. C42_A2020_068]
MSWTDFVVRLLVAFILGAAIGVERQWLKTRAVLKTNVLVSLGAAMFVMMSAMTPGDSSPTRVAAQVVSGIGFLGGGVILREGATVRGINTAATLWCAAAIGTLAGSGFFLQAYIGAIAVVGANFLLRPLIPIFQQVDGNVNLATQTQPSINYRCWLICQAEDEMNVRTLLFQSLRERELTLTAIHSKTIRSGDPTQSSVVEIQADFFCGENADELELIEQVLNTLKQQTKIDRVSWELVPSDRD